jgi:hypothetical protein
MGTLTLWVSQPSHLKSLSSQNISPLQWVCVQLCTWLYHLCVFISRRPPNTVIKNDNLCCLHCQVKDFYDIPSSSAREWPGLSVVSTKVKHLTKFSLSHSLSLFATEYRSSTVVCWLCIGALSFRLMQNSPKGRDTLHYEFHNPLISNLFLHKKSLHSGECEHITVASLCLCLPTPPYKKKFNLYCLHCQVKDFMTFLCPQLENGLAFLLCPQRWNKIFLVTFTFFIRNRIL